MRLVVTCVLVWLGSNGFGPVAGSSADSRPSPAGSPTISDNDPRVILQAETLEYYRLEKRLVATGKVVITSGRTRVFADRVELHTDNGIGTAVGHVRLLTPEDDVRASRLEFNLTSEQGLLYDGTGVVTGVYHVTGKRIARLGPKTLEVQYGRITTCTSDPPDWEFRAREARLGLGNYVRLKHPSFWIKGVPVFYVPYFIFPIKDKRTTGFLPPHVGFTSKDGTVVGTEFFWAMADWTDTTVGLEYLSERGFKPEVEYRYAIDPLSDGRVKGAFIRDRTTDDTLWRVVLQQRQEFGWGLRGLTQIDLRSDRDLLRRFSRDLRQESLVHRVSFGALTKRFSDSTLTLEGASFDGIPESGSTQQFRQLPMLRFEQFPTSLGGIAFGALEASYRRLNATEIIDNTPVQRLDLFPRLSLPLTLSPWMHLTLTGGVRETFYDHQTTQDAVTTRQLVDLQAHLQGPALWRRYQATEKGQAFVHVIESRLDYRYVPEVDQRDLPAFETLDVAQHFLDPLETLPLVDRIAAANYAKVSLISYLYAQPGEMAVSSRVQEVARLVFSQGFDIHKATKGHGQLLGPFDVEIELHLWQRWHLASSLRLDTATGALEASSARLVVALPSGWSILVGSNYRQDPDIQYVSGGISVPLLQGLQLAYNFRYDGLRGTFREHLVALRYHAQCWSVDMSLRLRETENTPFFASTNFFVRFNLLHF